MSSMYQLAKALTDAEDAIDEALRNRGDHHWTWRGQKANPNVVPLLFNEILVTAPDGSQRAVAAIEYVGQP